MLDFSKAFERIVLFTRRTFKLQNIINLERESCSLFCRTTS